MKLTILKLYLIPLAIIFNSCGSSESTSPSTTVNPLLGLDTNITIDTTFALQTSSVNVYQGDVNLTTKIIQDVRSMTEKVELMADKATTTIELSETLVKNLAKDFSLNSAYSTEFSINTAYDLNSPYFIINAATTKNFLLLSSSTRLFVPRKTVKTYFNDSTSLLLAWQRSLNSYVSGHLYVNIYEIKADGIAQRVGNSFLIPESKMKTILNLT